MTGLADQPPRRVCLIGAECTGKSTLAQQLAAQTDGVVVPEVLRDWCVRFGRTPRSDEQAALMQAQIHAEDQALALIDKGQGAMLFCECGPLQTAVYSQFYFADNSLLAAAHLHQSRYAMTLWLQPDLPWVVDGLQRDGPVVQAAVHRLLGQQLAQHSPVVAVGGVGSARLQAAMFALHHET